MPNCFLRRKLPWEGCWSRAICLGSEERLRFEFTLFCRRARPDRNQEPAAGCSGRREYALCEAEAAVAPVPVHGEEPLNSILESALSPGGAWHCRWR